ncbi:Acyl-[acyl-carrier-protein]--UDP-N-acetylglucosamine O-acyltransferase [hydrothermal vent metagenome]|uniref:Acyl-[acyl-carrier-protein]--UDP-N-acetylglucosamine O-acyltransferase n=1 Tax=hydrothermal vent metagenome TaxID=652676 RepID=A0A3B0YHB7_9ZZZZ
MPANDKVSLVHPTAVIDPQARVAADVIVGPYSIIGAGVEINAGSWIAPHVVIVGTTIIGRDNRIFSFASLGDIPQDKKYNGEPTRLEIGDRNTIREYVTINRGTEQDGGVTHVGNDNWIMAYVHIAHDCRIGDHTVLANNATLAGHVHVGDYVTLGGSTLVHQYCHIGEYAFSAYGARINKDVPPFITVDEGKARPRGLNSEGLKRNGFDEPRIRSLKEAYRLLYRADLPLEQAIEQLAKVDDPHGDVARLQEFISGRQRSIVR